MAKARVIFHQCLQDSQNFGSDDEHMISRVSFTLEIDGRRYEGGLVDIKQTVGSSYETGPIEVGPPKGFPYEGPFNYEAFQVAVERYYRSCVGSTASGIRLGPGAVNIRMRNNLFKKESVEEFEVSGSDAAW